MLVCMRESVRPSFPLCMCVRARARMACVCMAREWARMDAGCILLPVIQIGNISGMFSTHLCRAT